MSWRDLVCLLLVIIGAILFLYGANYYDATTGWTGVGLFVSGIVLYVVLQAFEIGRKKETE
jgi:membrane-bound ClpP family serine protease